MERLYSRFPRLLQLTRRDFDRHAALGNIFLRRPPQPRFVTEKVTNGDFSHFWAQWGPRLRLPLFGNGKLVIWLRPLFGRLKFSGECKVTSFVISPTGSLPSYLFPQKSSHDKEIYHA